MGHFHQRAVQVGVEPVNLTAVLVTKMVHPRQRAPGFIRVVNIGAALLTLLLQQQAVALPQEAGVGGAVRRGDDFPIRKHYLPD